MHSSAADGWAIYLGHAPSEAPKIEKYTSPSPLDKEAFFAEVMKIAKKAADGVREAIAQDWPRRSTKPDKEGRAEHPLFGGVSANGTACIAMPVRPEPRWQPTCGTVRNAVRRRSICMRRLGGKNQFRLGRHASAGRQRAWNLRRIRSRRAS